MNPHSKEQEKAKEFIEKFYEKMAFQASEYKRDEIAKQCALICVEEILKDKEDAYDVMADEEDIELVKTSLAFWQSVKQHIQNL